MKDTEHFNEIHKAQFISRPVEAETPCARNLKMEDVVYLRYFQAVMFCFQCIEKPYHQDIA